MQNPSGCISIFPVILLLLFPALSVGASAFHDIVAKKEYIDRSIFLEYFMAVYSQPVYITAPRQFGKSTLISMMEEFYDVHTYPNGTPVTNQVDHRNYGVFTNVYNRGNRQLKLDIANSRAFNEHFGKYPVLKLDFSNLTVETHMQFLISLRSELQKAFEKYKILLNSTMKLHKYASEILTGNFTRIKDERKFRTSLIIGTSNLTKTIFHHFEQRKIMVLIDAFDAPVSKWLVSDWKAVEYEILKTHETMCDFIASLFLNLKNFLAAGFLTGRTRHGNIYAHRAEVISYIRFTENARIASAFALTEANVENLLQIHASSNMSLKMLKHFFGGYAVQNSPNLVLNTNLTIESIEKDDLVAPRGLDHEGFSHALRLDHAGLEILRVFAGENVTTYLSNKIGLLNLMDLNDNFLPLSAINTTWKNYSRENVQRLTEYMHDLGYFTTKRGVTKGWVELKTPNVETFESLLQEVTMAVKNEFNLQEDDMKALQHSFFKLSDSASRFQNFMDSVQTLFKSVGDVEASKIRGVLFLVLVRTFSVHQAVYTSVQGEEIQEPLEGGLNFLLPMSESRVVLEVQVNSSVLSVFQRLVDEHADQRVSEAKNRILVGINYEPVHKRFSGVFSFNSDKPNTESVATLSNTQLNDECKGIYLKS